MSTADKARIFGNKFGAGAEVLADGTEEYKGDVARLQSFIGAVAIADLVKSTLGPMGMDKILLSTSGKDMTDQRWGYYPQIGGLGQPSSQRPDQHVESSRRGGR